MNEGYVLVWRKVFENPLYSEKPFDRWHAFEDLCILRPAYARHRVRFMGYQLTLKRGQFVVTKNQLAQRWGWSWDKVDRFIKLLAGGSDPSISLSDAARSSSKRVPGEDETADEARNETGKKTGTPVIIVTVLKYDLYQRVLPRTGKRTGRVTGRGTGNPTGNRPGTDREPTGNDIKKGKKGNESLSSPTPSLTANAAPSAERERVASLKDPKRAGPDGAPAGHIGPLPRHPDGRDWTDSHEDLCHPRHPRNWNLAR